VVVDNQHRQRHTQIVPPLVTTQHREITDLLAVRQQVRVLIDAAAETNA
jgi:hypothetical protein